MYKQVINKNDLISLGYSEYSSKDIIRQARIIMVESGCSYYESKKVTTVPVIAVSEVLGFTPQIMEVK